MHRTQIYLDDRHYEILRARAKREEKSLAAVIREILDDYLVGGSNRGEVDPMNEVIGLGKGDGAAVAEHYEDYLYGRGEEG